MYKSFILYTKNVEEVLILVTIIEGDLFETDANIICHQVNCRGVMGSGVALQVKKKYPHIYHGYVELCKSHENLLGEVFVASTNPKFEGFSGDITDQWQTICNLFAQDRYGRDKCYTSYEAMQKCFDYVRAMTLRKNNHYGATIAMPYMIGCGLGGGDWDRVYKMINDTFAENNVEL